MTDLRHDAIATKLLVPEPTTLPRTIETREAAVAVILRGEVDPDVLLIRRADHPGDAWAGHMAFPGGRHEPGDIGLADTAVRETREELGIDLEKVARPLGQLDEIDAIARGRRVGMVIRPYVFGLETASIALTPNEEVAEVVWAKLRPMLERANATTVPYEREGFSFSLPAFDVDGRVVWGLTYHMLELLFARLR